MNDAQKRLGELLADAPTDDAFRTKHRDAVRVLALHAFDEATNACTSTTVAAKSIGPPRRRIRTFAYGAVIAASVFGVLVAWLWVDPSSDGAFSPGARGVADSRFLAAIAALDAFDEDGEFATFDQGVQACLNERLLEVASASP
jgi:hypothetical protein